MSTIVHAWIVSVLLSATPEVLPPPQEMAFKDHTGTKPPALGVWAPDDWAEPVKQYLWLLNEVLEVDHYPPAVMERNPKWATITISRATDQGIPPNGYTLEISSLKGMTVQAPDLAGVFNALATLGQLFEQCRSDEILLPNGRIRDWPALAMRGVHLDLTCQQYTPQYVQQLMRTLARYKVNAILMEYSDMFPFRDHPAIRLPDAFSESDVQAIRRTASACNQELIPFLQCLGHLQYVLHREPYAHLGETHDRYMLCPSDPASVPFAKSLIDEMLAQHPGLRYLHIGGDEVGPYQCKKCLAYVKEHNFSELYIKHYTPLIEYCKQRGVIPLMWSDMVVQHPEALARLPRDVLWVVWDYYTTQDPAPAVAHGAQMGKLDQLKPDYRKLFGASIGLMDAQRRGGLVAFGHALAFKTMGFGAFTGPAARCSGDTFDLPEFKLHSDNTRLAFLKAAEFGLPGSIITSWSYRGSPHEVCLPEYACASYGWNTKTPDVPALLGSFFRGRYGVDQPGLAAAVLDDSSIKPPSTLARPLLDDHDRAWHVTAKTQLDQIKAFVEKDPDGQLAAAGKWRQQLERTRGLWNQAMASAKRHQRELRYGDLSRRHLIHRLDLLQPLGRLVRVKYFKDHADEQQVDQLKQQLQSLAGPREALRKEWIDLYTGICTPRHLQVELHNRFDAEADIIQTVLSAE